MLLVNKLVQFEIRERIPSLITTTQLAFCAAVVTAVPTKYHLMVGGAPNKFVWVKMKPFVIYCLGFVGSMYCNMRALAQSNIETVIVFRACTPLAVSVLDYFYLGRSLPSRKSFGGLSTIVLGALIYVLNDAEFTMNGVGVYFWVTMYFGLICFSMVFGKALIKDVDLTLSGNVLYTNCISIPMMLSFGIGMGELSTVQKVEIKRPGFFLLLLSCVAGTGIAYAGWWCRGEVSATTFTLVGVVNKVFTVLVNLMIWDNHATAGGIFGLLLCLVGAAMYEPAKPRNSSNANSNGVRLTSMRENRDEPDDEESASLIPDEK